MCDFGGGMFFLGEVGWFVRDFIISLGKGEWVRWGFRFILILIFWGLFIGKEFIKF